MNHETIDQATAELAPQNLVAGLLARLGLGGQNDRPKFVTARVSTSQVDFFCGF